MLPPRPPRPRSARRQFTGHGRLGGDGRLRHRKYRNNGDAEWKSDNQKKEEADEMSKFISQLQLNEWECNQCGAQYAASRPLGGRRTQSDSG